MSNAGENELPAVVVTDGDASKELVGDEGEQTETGNTSKKDAASDTASKKLLDPSGGARKKTKQTSDKLKMPSQQAYQLTTAYNYLAKLKRAKSAKNIVHEAVKAMESELFKLKDMLDAIEPTNDLQRKFKTSWIAKNVERKEAFLQGVKKALLAEEFEGSSESSTTSSQALQEAEEEEALLLLEREQMERRQALRQRQRQEELAEQQEQERLQRRLLEVQARKDAASRTSSRASSGRRGRPLATFGSNLVPNVGPNPTFLPMVDQPTSQWIQEARSSARAEQANPSASMTEQLMQQMLLSQAKVPVFKGDQLEYLWFKQAFEVQIERVSEDPIQRLYKLMQALEGEPLRLVRGCQLASDPREGFARAKALLDERYGHPVRQTLAFREKLMAWGPVRSGTELTAYCIHLQQCLQVKMGGARLNELDAAATILTLASKLPERIQTAWQNRVITVETKEGREVAFEDFVTFVQRQERARNHPVFGKLGQEARDTTKAQTQAKSKTFTTGSVEREMPGANSTASDPPGHKSDQSSSKTASEDKPNAFRPPCLFCDAKDHATIKCKATSLTKEEKRDKLRGLCFACLKPGHSARQCRFRLKCSVCQGLHPTVLHEERTTKPKENAHLTGTAAGAGEDTAIKESALVTKNGSGPYALATARVKVWLAHHNKCVEVTALMDAASTATFISKEIVGLLGAPTRPLTLQLSTMAGEEDVPVSVLQGLKVADLDCNHVLTARTAYVVEALPEPGARIREVDALKWPHLREIMLPSLSSGDPIHMLIGQSVEGAHVPEEVRVGNLNEPFAVKTKLGWTVQGPIGKQEQGCHELEIKQSEVVNLTGVADIKQSLHRLHYNEFRDAYDFCNKGPSREDLQWMKLVHTSTQHLDTGHFCIELPFREGAVKHLTNNKRQALQRLQHLGRRFAADPTFKADYCNFMQKMMDAGHVEPAPDAAGAPNQGNCANYIPHHGVYHPQKHKIRVVFNCASKYNNVSLNDCLLSGPDLTNSIVAVLTRFRQFKVPFTADVEAMFYQVLVPEHQRDYLRFLWWEAGRIAVYRLRVHLFGATSSPSIANYALKKSATVAMEKNGVSQAAEQTVHKNFYVDDCLKSMDTTEGAIRMAEELVAACKFGGFNLTKFVSSDLEFLRAIGRERLAKELDTVDLNDDKADPLGSLQERALGVFWDVASDQLGFAVNQKREEETTKRQMLSRISQVYDPLGMAAPVIIVARMLFRELINDGKEWDEALHEDEQRKWAIWTSQLTALQEVRLTRWMGLKQNSGRERYQLHAFADASTKAYAAVVYIRVYTPQDDTRATVSFVLGKARVTPPKVVTIPRLELVAAKLAVDLLTTAEQELEVPIESRMLWSDSQTVLKYLANQKRRFHVFVANRIEAILNASTLEEWHYVPTDRNPADEGTRGLSATELARSSWLRGPSFLQQHETEWPVTEAVGEVEEQDPEVKGMTSCYLTQVEETEPFVESWALRYSSMFRFRRAAAVWLRVKAKLRGQVTPEGQFRVPELKQAESALLQWLQSATWAKEMQELRNGNIVPYFRRLAPQLNKGLIMMRTRTQLLLPIVPDGPLAHLLVREAHELSGHLGRQTTAAVTRRKYWIIHLSKIAAQTTRSCPSCQRRKARPAQTVMAPLPDFRLDPGPPFHTTGIDFFGPFHVRQAQNETKAYGVLFTCASSRAVHLELAPTLELNSFMNALRRFCARRGSVKRIVSDNATNLVGVDNALRREVTKVIDQHKANPAIVSKLREKEIEWLFIPPLASHFGGFYERLIRSVRGVLTALMEEYGRRAVLPADSLATLLCECESILNDRPLTTTGDDPNDLEALTPNHLLLGRRAEGALPGDYSRSARALKHHWRLVQHLVGRFWQRWTSEYSSQLHQSTKWHTAARRPIKEGDVVLLLDPIRTPREYWKLARVQKTHPSKDGRIRVVEVQTKQGIFTRPITKICLLEAASENE